MRFLHALSPDQYWSKPFSDRCIWNKVAGTVPVTDIPNMSSLTINHEYYSVGIHRAKSTDPVRTITATNGGSVSINVPAGADASLGTDAHFAVLSPDGLTYHEFFGYNSSTETAFSYKAIPANGYSKTTGQYLYPRAYGGSCVAGLLHYDEVMGGQPIEHRLAIGMPETSLTPGPIFPAINEDNPNTGYVGTLRMGEHILIDQTINIPSLITNAVAIKIAQAMQTYGGHIVDRAGSAGSFKLYAHHNVSSAVCTAAATDLLSLAAYFVRSTA